MKSTYARLTGIALLACAIFVATAHAQSSPSAAPQQQSVPAPQNGPRDSSLHISEAVGKKLDELAGKIEAVELHNASDDAVFGFLGAGIGAFVGAGASLLVLWRTNRFARIRDEQAELQRRSAVRTLIKSEINLDLAMLADEAKRIDVDERPSDMNGIEWVAVHPCPRWSLVAFEQTAAQLHGALTDLQIQQVQSFYGNLRSYTAARESLSALHQKTQIHKFVSVPYDAAEVLLKTLLATKNPLA